MNESVAQNDSIQSYMQYSENKLQHEDSFLKRVQGGNEQSPQQDVDPSLSSQEEEFNQSQPILDQQEQNQEEVQIEAQKELNQMEQYELLRQSIIKSCQEHQSQWTDKDFPPTVQSLYKDPNNIPIFAKDIRKIEWKRPHEISKDAKFMIDTEGEFKQGAFGESWFVGALIIISQIKKQDQKQKKKQVEEQPTQVEKLIVDSDYFDEYGFVTFQFFKNGEWKQVTVDTLLPYDNEQKLILYTQCQNPSEFWIPLMEKAYTKLHGNYETICEGHIGEGLVDLTAGVAETLNIIKSDQQQDEQQWQLLLHTHKQQFFMGCIDLNEAKGTKNADTGIHGILENHHYGIVDVREFPKEKLKLIRIRNVWGPEGGWNGAFSDDSEEWDKHRNLREELKLVFKSKKSDGTWWMQYSDWTTYFKKLYICKVFPETWQQYSIQGKWAGKTQGGPCPPKLAIESQNEFTQIDTDEKWFNNPQYKLKVSKETKIYLSLMLEDEKLSQSNYVQVNCMVMANKARLNRIWERPPQNDIIIELNPRGDIPPQREITQYFHLKPFEGKANGIFMIVPNMMQVQENKKDERNFYLRIFASAEIDIAEMPETVEQVMEGSWADNTAGGKRKQENGQDNPHWCKNPQYFLNLSQSTHLKIILKKLPNKKAKGTRIGMTICRFDKTNLNQLNIIKQPKAGGTNLARLLKQTQQQLEAPKMEGIERKLLIGSNEKFKQSTYFSEDVAALYFNYNPTEGPFIIIPSLDLPDKSANYRLTIYSNNPVELVKLDESKNAVLVGQWKADISDGGCHLYEEPYEKDNSKKTWTTNPKYQLTFNEPLHLKVTLCIAEKNWKSKTKNTVGGMIGVYLIEKNDKNDNKTSVEQIVRVPNFMPINEIKEEFDLQVAKNGYFIMPTTYASRIQGSYILSVQADKEFTLTMLK